MASSAFPDPLQLWRDAIDQLEKDANALATQGIKSPGLMRSLQQASGVSLGLQQAYGRLLEAHLQRANLPSRRQLDELAETLERIEHKLDRLLPPEADVPRPARTRRPSGAAAPAPVPAPAPTRTRTPAAAPRKPAARRTRKA